MTSPTDEKRLTVCLDMDHLLMVVLLLWSSGLRADEGHISRGPHCGTASKVDVVLLLTFSGSMSPSEFKSIRSFFARSVNALDIGPDRVQIGLVQYNEKPRTKWHLKTYQTKEALLEAIHKLRLHRGGPMTGRALNFALHNHFKPNAGMREDSQKMVVLFTDGESQDDVLRPSQNLKDAGIELYAIGVKDANESELRSMVSKPHEIHMHYLEDFSDLPDIVNNLAIFLCNSTNIRGVQCETTAKADIVLLLDQSTSIHPVDFESIKSIVARMVNVFYIGPDQVQIGLILYSSAPSTKWHLNTYQTKEPLLKAILTLQQVGGNTETGRALHFALHNHFKPNVGMREDSQKMVVLFTDGESQDDVLRPSQNLKDAGIELYAIGVKGAKESELRSMVSKPHEIHMHNLKDFSDLPDIVNNLTINLCNSANIRVPVMLVGGASHCAGTLEVKRGEWGPVYGSNWTLTSAAVVCRVLDCGSAVSTEIRNESLCKSAWEISSNCVQSGYTLKDCVSSGSSSSVIEITCSESARLVNGTSLCSGRLEVKSNQSNQWWSSVCEADFDWQDAVVVCRELNCGAPSVLQGLLYEEVEALMWTKEFQCRGHESALLDCGRSGLARNTCSPGKAVGLTCSEPLRLVGGSSSCAGTLELKQGDWGPVYGSNWTLMSAAAVCGELDCGIAVSTQSRDDPLNRSAWRIGSDCDHSGSALRECVTLSRSSSILEITCADPAVFIIRLVLLLLTLLSFITAICCVQKATRGQTPGPQEKIDLDYRNLGVYGAEGGPAEEEGAQAAQ